MIFKLVGEGLKESKNDWKLEGMWSFTTVEKNIPALFPEVMYIMENVSNELNDLVKVDY